MFKKLAFLLCCLFICCSHVIADDSYDSWTEGDSFRLDFDSLKLGVNPERSFMSNKRSAVGGDTRSQTTLAWCYLNGFGTGKNVPEALKWYRKASDKGSATAMLDIGYLYLFGYEVELDYVEAFKFLSKAVDVMSEKTFVEFVWSPERRYLPEVQYNLGLMYASGLGVDVDFVKAVDLFEKAATAIYGSVLNAKVVLCKCYLGEFGVKKNFVKAYLYARDAAEAGNGTAQSYLGDFYKDGIVVDRDLKEAFDWYKKSYEQGTEESVVKMAHAYFQGEGVEKDRKKAFNILEQSNLQKNVRVQDLLGYFYYHGIGTEKNIEKALDCYERSSSLGSDFAKKMINRHDSSKKYDDSGSVLKKIFRF